MYLRTTYPLEAGFQPPNLERILCRSKISSESKIFEVKNARNHTFVVNKF